MDDLSIILPAKNEAANLQKLLPQIRKFYPQSEIVVVDDGSSDATAQICASYDVRLIRHPYSLGNGAAIKTGARAASGKILVFLDADCQHRPEDIQGLLAKLGEGYDMVVGSRRNATHASMGRWWANSFYNRLASWIVGQRIEDLTSGFRAVHADKFRKFIYLLPNGFSYPTTTTMAFFRAGYPVAYIPVDVQQREGKSHIRPLRDGIRFLLIIFRIGTLYSPLKLFVPISLMFFVTALGYYLYTYMSASRFTTMTAMLFSTSVLIFLIGLVSEQITNLLYSHTNHED